MAGIWIELNIKADLGVTVYYPFTEASIRDKRYSELHIDPLPHVNRLGEFYKLYDNFSAPIFATKSTAPPPFTHPID